ncbi:hypothetical protein ATY81_06840 [Rhizobium sp. R72]|nr:hypothetical protein ATY81_06840 [Rhizobium sp. R72]OWW01326.1 hypothetical protein ATY80_06840 [Rhizobium sp. R711]
MRLLLLEPHDHCLDRLRQLVGVTHRPSRPIRQRLQAVILVAIEDLVAGLARDAELPAHIAHAFALKQPGDKT